ncbi:hypothetical protein ANANG_G00146410 [Anguilla anguilla]|uniref:Uncharacterized protein n=1 Tax=Anguilla anguilla TaxID=7936 RepID=A0A9D3MBT3_ANGAN|nr:hypothetical protein ANANG_G00146410 [Anguilla anguilla]
MPGKGVPRRGGAVRWEELSQVLLSLHGVPEGAGQPHAGHPRPGDLLQVLLREEVRAQGVWVRPGAGTLNMDRGERLGIKPEETHSHRPTTNPNPSKFAQKFGGSEKCARCGSPCTPPRRSWERASPGTRAASAVPSVGRAWSPQLRQRRTERSTVKLVTPRTSDPKDLATVRGLGPWSTPNSRVRQSTVTESPARKNVPM